MNFTLKAAADYWKTAKAPKAFLTFIDQIKKIITFTQERANRLIRFTRVVNDYKAGKLVQDIEKKYGCSRHTVLRYARLAGLEKRPKSFDPSKKEAVIQALREGLKLKDIARRNNCSEAYVSKTAGEAGLNRYRRK